MLTIIPLQDWFAMDDSIKRKDIESERINVPANSTHYWRYRMHITLEQLLQADNLNNKIVSLIKEAGRKIRKTKGRIEKCGPQSICPLSFFSEHIEQAPLNRAFGSISRDWVYISPLIIAVDLE